jgi:hypothetical protein
VRRAISWSLFVAALGALLWVLLRRRPGLRATVLRLAYRGLAFVRQLTNAA